MSKKIKVLLLLISLSICTGMMSNTYSRYVADTKGNIDVLLARWQILVNEIDITASTDTQFEIVPVLEENLNIPDGHIAPASKGHFDIEIDPSNVELSFEYKIELLYNNENIPDLIIAKYSIIYEDEDEPEVFELNDSKIEKVLTFEKETSDFKFRPFTVRVYFEWYDGEGKLMTDEEQAEKSLEYSNFNIDASVSFKQVV